MSLLLWCLTRACYGFAGVDQAGSELAIIPAATEIYTRSFEEGDRLVGRDPRVGGENESKGAADVWGGKRGPGTRPSDASREEGRDLFARGGDGNL